MCILLLKVDYVVVRVYSTSGNTDCCLQKWMVVRMVVGALHVIFISTKRLGNTETRVSYQEHWSQIDIIWCTCWPMYDHRTEKSIDVLGRVMRMPP
jgi:hypothetical protein